VVTSPSNFYNDDTYIRILPYGQVENNLAIPKGYEKNKILFTHEDISGLTYGSNQIESGTPLKYQIFGDWDIVFNGHIHKHQKVYNICNIGSPMIQDWGEAGEKKYFIVYDRGSISKIEIDCPQFISYNSIQNFLDIPLDSSEFSNNFYRIDIYPHEASDPIFKNYNVTYNICKSEKREIKLSETLTPEQELTEYIKINNEGELDFNKLLRIGLELRNV
jgi:DNA repair exonuclease SbcCD nuclease subunit